MKNIIAFSLFAFAFSFASFAAPSWASINTDAYNGKTGYGNVTSYSAYYCTADAAESMFEASTVSELTTYFKNNFATGVSELQSGATALTKASWSTTESYYTFYESPAALDADADYVGFALYVAGETQAFRIFGADNPEIGGNYVAFDSSSADVGGWTTVPEPTSALLLLAGLAGLALKRKQ